MSGTPYSPSSSNQEDLLTASDCINRCYLHGLATTAITFTGFYLGQRSMPTGFGRPVILASSSFFAVVGGYLVTNNCIKDCVKSARMARETRSRTRTD